VTDAATLHYKGNTSLLQRADHEGHLGTELPLTLNDGALDDTGRLADVLILYASVQLTAKYAS
jgi:hypothetical protein